MEFSKKAFFYFAFIMLLYSCGDSSESEPVYENSTETYDDIEDVYDDVKETSDDGMEGTDRDSMVVIGSGSEVIYNEKGDTIAVNHKPITSDDYKVVLETDENLKMNEAGELKVWIGAKDIIKIAAPDRVQDETLIPASIGQYAKITPYAPDFTVTPLEVTCIKIHPSGSDVRFTLIPNKSGTLKVSANIQLYDTPDCTGTAVPKTAATLSVVVKVDTKSEVMAKLGELGTIVWDNFLTFWGALVALLFGALFFIIRRKIKKKTGYDHPNENDTP